MSIEKFSGTFSSEANGVTVLVNSVIQSIKDIGVLGLYTYLASKPDTWEPNAKEIMRHFNFSKDKVYRLINALIKERLMTMKEIRDKGRFAHYSYTIHLHRQPLPENQDTVINTDISPCPEKPDAENKETYKEKRVKNKEKEVRPKNTTPQIATLFKNRNIKCPRTISEAGLEFAERAITLLAKNDTTLNEYLDYLMEECTNWLYEPYELNGKQRINDFYIILKPAILIKALAGEYEDRKHVT